MHPPNKECFLPTIEILHDRQITSEGKAPVEQQVSSLLKHVNTPEWLFNSESTIGYPTELVYANPNQVVVVVSDSHYMDIIQKGTSSSIIINNSTTSVTQSTRFYCHTLGT